MKKRQLMLVLTLLALVLGPVTAQARYLNPNTGRFQTLDSYEGSQSEPLSLHKYLYAQNNPVNATDPSGNDTLVEINVATFIQANSRSLEGVGLAAFRAGAIRKHFENLSSMKTRAIPILLLLLLSQPTALPAADAPLSFSDPKPQRYEFTARASEIDPRARPHPEIDFVFEKNGEAADGENASVDMRTSATSGFSVSI